MPSGRQQVHNYQILRKSYVTDDQFNQVIYNNWEF